MATTPIDLNGQPYTPILSYDWLTDARRATCAMYFACDPAQVEYRLDARAEMEAKIAERREYDDPYGYNRARY